MYQLRFWAEDNTFHETDWHDRWRNSTTEERTALASDGSVYRKYLSIWLPKNWRIRLIRIK